MNDRQLAALLDPVHGAPGEVDRHRTIRQAGDRTWVVTILAVDR